MIVSDTFNVVLEEPDAAITAVFPESFLPSNRRIPDAVMSWFSALSSIHQPSEMGMLRGI